MAVPGVHLTTRPSLTVARATGMPGRVAQNVVRVVRVSHQVVRVPHQLVRISHQSVTLRVNGVSNALRVGTIVQSPVRVRHNTRRTSLKVGRTSQKVGRISVIAARAALDAVRVDVDFGALRSTHI